MLFKDSEIESLQACKGLGRLFNNFYLENSIYFKNSDLGIKTQAIFVGLSDLIIKIDKFLKIHNYISVDFVNKFESGFREIYKSDIKMSLKIFEILKISKVFLKSFHEIHEYKGDYAIQVDMLLKKIDTTSLVHSIQAEDNFKIYGSNLFNSARRSVDASESSRKAISQLRSQVDDSVLSKNKDENEIKEFNFYESDIYVNFKNKSDGILKDFNDEINRSKANFKKDVEDEVAKFKVNFTKVDTDFKNSVKDFEILKKFINAKGEKEITDHYKNKAKWERVTYWLMTVITFGIIIFSVCMALNGLDDYKEKANISIETLLEKYKTQPVEKIEKLYAVVQSSALTYLVLRLIFSVLLFSSIIYTSRVAYRAYIHMRHSENMMLKLATLRPFINQLDENERNQIHKDLVPDYFGKDAGLVDGASEKFKDLPANVSAVAMKAIEQIGGSPSTNNSKAPDPKDAKTAGE